MSKSNPMGLRDGRERVTVIVPIGTSKPVLGVSHPQEDRRRADAVRQWGTGPESPRQQPLATVDEPLPVRVQTILSHEIDPAIAQALNAGTPLPGTADKRRAEPAPVTVSRLEKDRARLPSARVNVGIKFDSNA